jgi:ribonuclease P protein component
MPSERLLREHRIRSRDDFQRAYRLRCTAADDRLLVFAAPNGLPFPRLGLSVSRKVGNAVVRNRWKRLIREAFRLERESLPAGLDLVVVPRGQTQPSLLALRQSLPRLAGRVVRKIASRPSPDSATRI